MLSSTVDQRVQENLRAQGADVTLNIAGIHGTKDMKTERFPLKIKVHIQRTTFKGAFNRSFSRAVKHLGKHKLPPQQV